MKKVLIANRGEIACRIMRSARTMGLQTVAVYSEIDAQAQHVCEADQAFLLGPAPPRQSYLDIERLLAAARSTGADAVHPGYGFLSENADFAAAVLDAGLIWIGPTPDSIRRLGDKARSRALAQSAGVPILPGSRRFGPDDLADFGEVAGTVGFPLLVKASGGGGGIGMRQVNTPGDVAAAVSATQALAARAFGDGTVFLERYVSKARHIEVQVFGMGDGRAVHLFERECSIQRRFQKVVEESPSTALNDDVRQAMTAAAVNLASQLRYAGAGTVEFVFDDETRKFYFLEMNTRIQVEHPVTEMVTGIDLVAWQLSLAAGEQPSVQQHDIASRGHAIECRIYAENPAKNFLPSVGVLTELEFPSPSEHVRIDTGLRRGDAVTIHYDPMIAKVICKGASRDEAIDTSIQTLQMIHIDGPKTNASFLRNILAHGSFRAGLTSTAFIDMHKMELA